MQDETMQDTIKDILLILSVKYPNLYRADGLNPMSNRVAGYIMSEIMDRLERDKNDIRSLGRTTPRVFNAPL